MTFLVVGGGPTSIEFASELHDFLTNDVRRWYPDLADRGNVVLVEAGKHLLGTFDESLSSYVEKLFAKRNVTMLTEQAVSKVEGEIDTTHSIQLFHRGSISKGSHRFIIMKQTCSIK